MSPRAARWILLIGVVAGCTNSLVQHVLQRHERTTSLLLFAVAQRLPLFAWLFVSLALLLCRWARVAEDETGATELLVDATKLLVGHCFYPLCPWL